MTRDGNIIHVSDDLWRSHSHVDKVIRKRRERAPIDYEARLALIVQSQREMDAASARHQAKRDAELQRQREQLDMFPAGA